MKCAVMPPQREYRGSRTRLEGVPLLLQLSALGAVPGHCVVDVGDFQLHQNLLVCTLVSCRLHSCAAWPTSCKMAAALACAQPLPLAKSCGFAPGQVVKW